ncbi:hypothetical protein Tco_1205449 [Tanacetum coccineum]
MMSALEESRGVNLDWIIVDHLYKHTSGTKESSVICTGHYVTKIASSLGYCVDDEIKKCLEPIDYEIPTQSGIESSGQRQEPRGLNSSLGDWNASLNEVEHGNVYARTFHAHSPSFGEPSNQGGSYGLGGDDYFTSAMPDFRVSTTGNEVGGLSRGAV